MQTTVIFKTDKKLKEAAQKTAKQLGVPFSAVLNESMREFVKHKEITFRMAEDALWLERAKKAEQTGKYLGTKRSEMLLKRLRTKHAGARSR